MDTPIILDWIGLGIVRLDRDFRVTHLNSEAADLLGKTREELTGKGISLVVPESVRDNLTNKLRSALDEGSDLSIENFFPEPVNLWLSFRCRPVGDGLIIAIQDVTEKRQAEEALQRSHSILSQAEQIAHLGAWDIEFSNLDNVNSNPLRWTEEVYRIFGYEPGSVEVTNDLFFERVHHEDRQKISKAVAEALSDGRNYSIEHRIVRPDGSERIVLEHAEITFDEERKPLRMIGTVQDITDRKTAEEALLESEERFRTLADNISQLAWMADEEGRIFWYNKRWYEYTGTSLEEMRGWGWQKVHHPDHVQRVVDKISSCFKTGDLWEDTFPLKGKDGTYRWFLSRAIPIRDGQGSIVRWFGTNTDITERKQAEEQLERSILRFELLANSAGELLEAPDPQKIVQKLCLKVMEYLDCQAFFNFLVDESDGKLRLNAYAGIPSEEAQRIEWLDYGVAACGCAARDGCRVVAEHIFTNPDIRTELVRSYGIRAYAAHPLLSEGGKVIGTLSFGTRSRDVFSEADLSVMKAVADQVSTAMMRVKSETEIRKHRDRLEELVKERTVELEEKNRRLEEEMTEREKAEEEKSKIEAQLLQSQKIEALGGFAGGIAHELNNILYPMIVNTEILLDEAEAGVPSHEMLEQNLQNAYRQRDLIKQILSFSRQSIQKFSPVRIVPLLGDTLDFIRSTLPSSIEIRRSIDAPRDVIMGDATQIQQVIMNLSRNAADALESQQGIIEVRLRDAHLDSIPAHPEMKTGEYLELSISDTGKGIPPDIADRIFDPFYTTKDVGKGSGLGLSVVHGILKKHGGTIAVRSEEGKGSQFTLYLPLLDRKAKARVSESGFSDESRENILIVDDEEVILHSLKRALERMGYNVAVCIEPGGALSMFSKDPEAYDLVITDMTMPKMTGLDLEKEIKEIRPDIPVILCTGYSDLIDEREVEERGFSGMLMKPTGISELKKAVGEALEDSNEMSLTY